jgi:hypothetical protein
MERVADLQRCRDFDDLLILLEETVGEISDIGPLYEYDTALRIGSFLDRQPERVYLHAGTREGAKIFGLDGRSIEKSDLPASFSIT